ncbi:MAG: protein kinase, partial [Deltaproteobacteria bacterium]|nr:protein kinase [Deltaproteobacteria bacterium]
MIGAKLAHYEIVRKLGSGGMGDVYAARDSKLGREVALKVLPPELAEDEERRQRFEREARTAAALNHPNIVTLYAVEQDAGECFLTMELVEGEPLSKRIPDGGFDCDELMG